MQWSNLGFVCDHQTGYHTGSISGHANLNWENIYCICWIVVSDTKETSPDRDNVYNVIISCQKASRCCKLNNRILLQPKVKIFTTCVAGVLRFVSCPPVEVFDVRGDGRKDAR